MVSVDRSRCLVGVREPALKLVTRQASGGTASRRTVVMVGQERANHVEEAADFQKHICSVSPTSSQAPVAGRTTIDCNRVHLKRNHRFVTTRAHRNLCLDNFCNTYW